MTQDVAVRQETIVNPATGEAVDLAKEATDLLARERRDVTELRASLANYATFLDEELTRRLDKENTRSADVGEWHIETKAPTTLTFEPDRLAVAVHDLIAENLLGESVVDKLFIPQPDKINRREVDKLLKHADKRVREHVAAAGSEEPQRRSVSVKAL
jgi:hypothetical protein